MAFYSIGELENLGFKSLGENVLISDKASLYGVENISIGDNSRIDDFCVISAGKKGIQIGRNVHIAAFSSLIGAEKLTLSDFSGLSSRVSIYSSSDNYSGDYLTNPTIPSKFTNVTNGPVFLGRHVIVGAGSIILPNVEIGDGVAVGALSLVCKNLEKWNVYSGIPAKKLKRRTCGLLELEAQYL